MEYKKKDVNYCGVDYLKIKYANPSIIWDNMKYFHHYVIERYNIHKKKDIQCLPKPWTNDQILLNYRFTNVRREQDKQSKYLIDNITSRNDLSIEDKIMNIILFRFWNNWDTMRDLGGPWSIADLTQKGFKEVMRAKYRVLEENEPNRLWFCNAYNQGGTKMTWKFPKGNGYDMHSEALAKTSPEWEQDIPLRGFHIPPYIVENDIITKILNAKDQKECFETIRTIPGFANFLAYQVFVDCTYIKEFPFSENEFVIAGPGCMRGLDSLFSDKDGLSYEELLFYFRNELEGIFATVELMDGVVDKYRPMVLFDDLPYWDRYINIMSLENLMCEFSKYIKAVKGAGRPRNTYKGGNN